MSARRPAPRPVPPPRSAPLQHGNAGNIDFIGSATLLCCALSAAPAALCERTTILTLIQNDVSVVCARIIWIMRPSNWENDMFWYQWAHLFYIQY